ncbi:MAG: hypothetical protein ACLR8Y_00115 [Alistipes indistinctus]
MAPVDGIDVVTTLDIDVQDVAENALRKQLSCDADWGTAVPDGGFHRRDTCDHRT